MKKLLVTWDSVNKGSSVTLSENNMVAVVPNSSNTVRASVGRDTGKWYWEIEILTSSVPMIGIANENATLGATNYSTQNVRYYYGSNGYKYPEASSYGLSFRFSVIGVAVNLDNGTLEFFKDGVSQGISHTNIKSMGKIFPAISDGSSTASNNTYKANFGERKFLYPIPKGFKSYGNYPEPKVLFSKNNKTYSLESINTWYEPKMIGSNAPAPYVISASGSTWNPHTAFDGITDKGGWLCNATTGWIQIDFGVKKDINRVMLYTGGYSVATAPRDFEILGSNDGVNFTKIYDVKDKTDWVKSVGQEFKFKYSSYRYYRINVTRNNGGANYVNIDEIIFGCKFIEINTMPSLSKDNFIKYGESSLSSANQIITNKNYILQDDVSESSERLLITKIDRKPLSIGIN